MDMLFLLSLWRAFFTITEESVVQERSSQWWTLRNLKLMHTAYLSPFTQRVAITEAPLLPEMSSINFVRNVSGICKEDESQAILIQIASS